MTEPDPKPAPIFDFRPTCASCMYHADVPNDVKNVVCKAHPPVPKIVGYIKTPNPIDPARPLQKPLTQSYFPVMGVNDWCGEHPLLMQMIRARILAAEQTAQQPGAPVYDELPPEATDLEVQASGTTSDPSAEPLVKEVVFGEEHPGRGTELRRAAAEQTVIRDPKPEDG